jgi:hypothetical protein
VLANTLETEGAGSGIPSSFIPFTADFDTHTELSFDDESSSGGNSPFGGGLDQSGPIFRISSGQDFDSADLAGGALHFCPLSRRPAVGGHTRPSSLVEVSSRAQQRLLSEEFPELYRPQDL